MVLQVNDLCIARGGIRLLSGLHMGLSEGEALVLRGPNGIGKTTLLRTLAGLQPVVSGTIDMAEEICVLAGHADGVKTALTVVENLSFWARVFGRTEIDGALAAYQLEPLSDRPAGLLSAGQKRRLGLARLLVTGRPVWLLDEPTVSLDAHAVALFAASVRAHLQSGGVAVIATHIDLGLSDARLLDLTPYRASVPSHDAFDEAFR
ncbi:MAG: heme ABC exporter ATP-binding protein CcmA [Pseudomonadota bacterium]